MSTDPYDEILSRARKELTPEEQRKLIRDLSQLAQVTNRGNDAATLFDALDARGLIGSMKDAPADLGANPKHMEGFGQDDH